jgi:formylglycine-generating enzyme required for sulfatase activity
MISLKKLSIVAVAVVGATIASAQITIPTVPIGNLGNAVDPLNFIPFNPFVPPFGAVPYAYEIGATEVTNAQYTAFLNAKAASDPFGLYFGDGVNFGMALFDGGITRSGSSGSYTYATRSGRENWPVNYVNFWDAARFANWLHNGQGSGDTETGAYTLTPGGISGNNITRNAGALWAVPSEDEWYKAAYHQPASAGGDSDNYWLYPTASNTAPTTAQANIFGSGINRPAPVGSYAANYYGTFDMGGNVWEWNEAIIFAARGARGGNFGSVVSDLRANNRFYYNSLQNPTIGFRVVKGAGAAVAGMLTLSNTVGNSCTETIGWTLSNTSNTYTGSVVVTDFGSSTYSLAVPNAAPVGVYTLRFKGGTFLATTLNVYLSGTSLTSQHATLKNGDIDQDGEVGPSDFELVVAQFGGSGSADVDNDGEVGPADFEIIVNNFGLGDE